MSPGRLSEMTPLAMGTDAAFGPAPQEGKMIREASELNTFSFSTLITRRTEAPHE